MGYEIIENYQETAFEIDKRKADREVYGLIKGYKTVVALSKVY